ncbi:MAG: cysteine--tRNA ligase [Spirochaetales bacterium]
MDLSLFNTLGRRREIFTPLDPENIRMYSCGPTVYNYAHIGNLRAYVFVDLLRRVLSFFGYPVTHVMNITDVGHLTDDADDGEDKMVKSSRESGKSVWEIAQFYTDAFFRHTDALNILRPHIAPRATEHIPQMIELIRRLDERGFTYHSGGNVYFDTSKFPSYGVLARNRAAGPSEHSHAHSRVESDPNKRNPADFVLWFTRSKFENQAMVWDSPWGRGYPGWHIECSAMSMHYLGEQFDIHCGGVDHIAVHHSNEIAQSEAATGKKWVNYWLHNEFLVMEKGKMAKSSGGFITLDSLTEAGYDPLDYRYFCLLAHYRSELRFSWEALDAARSARQRITERVERLSEDAGYALSQASREARSRPASPDGAGRHLSAFEQAVADDLNSPKALAAAWSLVKDDAIPAEERLRALATMEQVLGLALFDRAEDDLVVPDDVRKLVAERTAARKERNFRRADEIRDTLTQRGYSLEDSPEGTRVRPIESQS